MSKYVGVRSASGSCRAFGPCGFSLEPRFDLANHSPDGFEWGYGGSGPAQLALALLAHHMGNGQRALDYYQEFKWLVVSHLPREGWTLTAEDIEAAIKKINDQRTEALCTSPRSHSESSRESRNVSPSVSTT